MYHYSRSSNPCLIQLFSHTSALLKNHDGEPRATDDPQIPDVPATPQPLPTSNPHGVITMPEHVQQQGEMRSVQWCSVNIRHSLTTPLVSQSASGCRYLPHKTSHDPVRRTLLTILAHRLTIFSPAISRHRPPSPYSLALMHVT